MALLIFLCLGNRGPDALPRRPLERVVGLSMTKEKSQVMLCGNPQMVKDVRAILIEIGLEKNLRRKPGNISTEQYW